MALCVLGGASGTHIPSVKARYALSEATLSIVLLAAAIGTVVALFIAGRIVGRLGARTASGLAARGAGDELVARRRAGVPKRGRAVAGDADLRCLDEPVRRFHQYRGLGD